MKAQLAAVFGAVRWPRAPLAGKSGPADRRSGLSLGQLIAALDDRDTRNALELLDPPVSGGSAGEHRIRCARGCKE